MSIVERLPEVYLQRAVEWTMRLVQLQSVNPPGNEYDVACCCAELLRDMGLEPDFDEYAPGRVNLTTFIGNRDDVGLILNGHMDVVPAPGEWRYPPFSAYNDGERVWGRGSADMKSGCACMLAAVNALVDRGASLKRGLCLSLTSDEELMGRGIRRMIERYKPRASAAIIGEPTSLQVHYGNRGYCSLYIRTKGVACHACEPRNGVNAIYKMGHVIETLEAFAEDFSRRTDPQLGSASFSLGLIRGGSSLNAVPASCEIEVESRGFPGMNAETLREDLRKVLPDDVEIELRSNLLASLVPADCEIVRQAAGAVREVLNRDAVIAKFPAWAETGFFTQICKIPAILLGPGDIALAHRVDEYVEIDEIRKAAMIYDRVLQNLIE